MSTIEQKVRADKNATGSSPVTDPNSPPDPAATLPTNVWSFLASCVRVLGGSAKVCIIVAAVGFGVYKYVELYAQQNKEIRELSANQDKAINEQRNAAEKQYRERLDGMQKKMDDAFVNISELSGKQIASVKSLLELQDRATVNMESQNRRLEDLRKKADEVDAQARETQASADRLKVEAAEWEKKSAELQSRLASQEQQLSANDKRMRENLAKLDRRVQDVNDLRVRYVSMARELLDWASNADYPAGFRESNVYELALAVQRDYFPQDSDAREPRARWLGAFAARPDANSLGRLQRLVGVKESEMEPMLKTGLGFKAWAKSTTVDTVTDSQGKVTGEERRPFYLGVTEFTDHALLNCVTIEGATEEKEATVDDVRGWSWMTIVRAPSRSDWFAWEDFLIVIPLGEQMSPMVDRPRAAKGSKWSFDRPFAPYHADSSQLYKLLYGEGHEFSFLTYEQLREQEMKGIAKAAEEDEELAEAGAMAARAKDFGAASIRTRDGVSLPEDVGGAFRQLLTALVNREAKEYSPLLSPNMDASLLGRMAAVALRKNFRVVQVGPLGDQYETRRIARQEQIAIQEQRAVRVEPPAPQTAPDGYEIYCAYDADTDDPYGGAVRFAFTRAPTSQGWVLTGFSGSMTAERSSKS
jgi:hypothetical protein